MFDWIEERVKERTSWDGAALIAAGVLFLVFGSWAEYVAYAAIVWGAWTMWTKEH